MFHKFQLFVVFAIVVTIIFIGGPLIVRAASSGYAGKIISAASDPSHLWYVSPVNGKRYDLGITGVQAVSSIRKVALGISSPDLKKIPSSANGEAGDAKLRKRLSGRFLLAVQEGGMLWYVNPKDHRRSYLAPTVASYGYFQSFKTVVTDQAIGMIAVGFAYPKPLPQPQEPSTVQQQTQTKPEPEPAQTGCRYSYPVCPLGQVCNAILNQCELMPQSQPQPILTGCKYNNPSCPTGQQCNTSQNQCELIPQPQPTLTGCKYSNPSCPSGQTCNADLNQCQTTCTTPACLESRKATVYSLPSNVTSTILAAPGAVWNFAPDAYVRFEALLPHTMVSIWTKDDKGCRLYANFEIVDQKTGYQHGGVYLTFLRLNDRVYVDAFTGNVAYNACTALSVRAYWCSVLPGSGEYTIADKNFRRIFPQEQYAPAESILLDLNIVDYQRVTSIFPSLLAATPPRGTYWQISEYHPSDVNAAGFMINGDIYAMQHDVAKIHDPFSTDVVAYQKARATINDTFDNWVDAPLDEEHEWGHAAFSPTQGQAFSDSRYGYWISEGLANYIEGLGGWGQKLADQYGKDSLACRDTYYGATKQISYTDTAADPYLKGECFYYLTQQVCGMQGMNDAFAEVLNQSYHATENYPHYFKIFEKHCADPASYDKILKNFGVADDVLTSQSPLSKGLLPGDACSQ